MLEAPFTDIACGAAPTRRHHAKRSRFALLEAMALALQHLRVVCEPSGAITLAALLADRQRFAGRTVATMLSGGNVDPATFRLALA